MRVKSIHLENFGSYKTLDLEFNKGLTLIHGPNGVGKSTIFDAVSWILFGVTAKGGKADEVKSWNGGVTNGSANIEYIGSIFRSRGPNDLYFNTESPERGKDLSDTQKLINARLGFGPELYQRGAYYHEFSETAQFFSGTAKSRRDLCESIADLSLAVKLKNKASDLLKTLQDDLTKAEFNIRLEDNKILTFRRLETDEASKADQWKDSHERDIRTAEENQSRFESNRRRIIQNKCRECGTTLLAPREVLNSDPNPYTTRLEELRRALCPHDGAVRSYQSEVHTSKRSIKDLSRQRGLLTQDKIDCEILLSSIQDFRGALIKNTIDYITTYTNKLLVDYFDGELYLALEIEGADKLDVILQKDGNIAAFTQLSKGQRQILKLCFSVAVMEAVSNHHGVKFEQLFFDESLDGLSDTMKVKAFRLFETLSQTHEDVFVIDHSEALKVLFPTQLLISNESGNSTINAST